MRAFGYFVAFTLATVILCLWRGIVLQALWGWFLVPAGLQMINTRTAVGISLIVAFLAKNTDTDKKSEEDLPLKLTRLVLVGIAFPLIVLCFGWVMNLVA